LLPSHYPVSLLFSKQRKSFFRCCHNRSIGFNSGLFFWGNPPPKITATSRLKQQNDIAGNAQICRLCEIRRYRLGKCSLLSAQVALNSFKNRSLAIAIDMEELQEKLLSGRGFDGSI
jgi:hypothetical protein